MTAITRALSSALLHFLWQGLVVMILLWLALFLLRKRSAAIRYAASCAALALLVALLAITTWSLYEHPSAAPKGTVLMDSLAVVPPGPASGGIDWLGLAQAWTVPVWSLGVLLFSLRMAWGCTQISALRRAGEAAEGQLRAAFAELAKRMGVRRPVRLLLSTVTNSPSLTGWLRPVVLLPVSALAGLTPDQLEAVLAHELAHIRRHDYLVNLLQMAAETLLFYHPAVWWISGRIRHERELCCDDLAVAACGGALTYARALTALEKMRAPRPAIALGSTDGPLFYRIRRLVTGADEYGPSKLTGTIALTLGLACLALCVNWVRAQEPARIVTARAEVQDAEGVTVNTAGTVVLHRPSVEYPGRLIERGIQGTVAVEPTIDAAGNVVDAHVLSGPAELRRIALSSVLNWHFSPVGGGNTRVIQISFQVPSTRSVAALELQSSGDSERRFAVVTRGPRGEDHANVGVAEEQAERTTDFLRGEYERTAERLAALQRQSGANPEQIADVQNRLNELQQRLERNETATEPERLRRQIEEHRAELENLTAAQEGRDPKEGNAEFRGWAVRFEKIVAEARRGNQTPEGQRLGAIQIRGMSDEAGNELLSRLPMHVGDSITHEMMESTTRAIREFDEHLEFNYGFEPEGAVLRIHPAGAAGAPILFDAPGERKAARRK